MTNQKSSSSLGFHEHLREEEIRRTVLGYTEGETARAVCRHLIQCPKCRKYQMDLLLGRLDIHEEEVSHPPREQIRQYREGNLPEPIWQKVDEHIFLCRSCDAIYMKMAEQRYKSIFYLDIHPYFSVPESPESLAANSEAEIMPQRRTKRQLDNDYFMAETIVSPYSRELTLTLKSKNGEDICIYRVALCKELENGQLSECSTPIKRINDYMKFDISEIEQPAKEEKYCIVISEINDEEL